MRKQHNSAVLRMDFAGSARQLQKVSFLTAISKLKLKVVTVRISNRSHGLF